MLFDEHLIESAVVAGAIGGDAGGKTTLTVRLERICEDRPSERCAWPRGARVGAERRGRQARTRPQPFGPPVPSFTSERSMNVTLAGFSARRRMKYGYHCVPYGT